MKAIRLLDDVEHRFAMTDKQPVDLLNDAAKRTVFAGHSVDATNGHEGSVAKVFAGAEMSVDDADAARLIELGLAEPVAADKTAATAKA